MQRKQLAVIYKEKTTGREYLAYYINKTLEEAEKEVEDINKNKPKKLSNGEPAECNEREYSVVEVDPLY